MNIDHLVLEVLASALQGVHPVLKFQPSTVTVRLRHTCTRCLCNTIEYLLQFHTLSMTHRCIVFTHAGGIIQHHCSGDFYDHAIQIIGYDLTGIAHVQYMYGDVVKEGP